MLTPSEQFAAGRGFFRYDDGAGPPQMQREVLPALTAPAGTAGAANSYARIAVDPTNHERCWIACHTGLWRREAGPNFIREPIPNNPAPVAPAVGAVVSDVILVPDWDPQRPNTLRVYAAVATVGVFRGVFDRDNAAAGTVWDPMLTDNLPLPSAPGAITWDRIRLGYCRFQPRHVYAVAQDPAADAILGVYHSTDAGDHWTVRPAPALGGQIWVNLYVEVHPDNPSIVVVGAVDLARSTDFGQNWATIIDWRNFSEGDRAQHGDQHAALFDGGDPRRLWACNDGGISMTPDIVQTNPRTVGSWRKRSHGLCASQFNDIATHPTYPFMVGGGLQDNGSYISFGGETWHLVGDADGGQMSFEIDDPRTYIVPNQSLVIRSVVVPAASVAPAPNVYPLVSRRIVNGDAAPPNDVFACQLNLREVAPLTNARALFVPLVEHHRTTPNHLLIGRGFVNAAQPADVFATTDNCTSYAAGNLPAATIGNADVSALAYGNGAAASTDWWVGCTQGQLLRRPNSGANPAVWGVQALPANAAGLLISRIAVHPADERYVAVAACDGNPPHQGRVYLTLDRGANWAEVTGLASVGAPPGGEPPLLSLPPSPVTSLAFDPQPAGNTVQALYAGTLAGVYVCRNLPRRRTPPAAGAVPAFNPRWFTFNGTADRPLPLTLVKDVRIITLPRDAAAPATEPEDRVRHRLAAAVYGRGMMVCDITRGYPAAIGNGGPAHRLYLRQTVIEDGLRYPRPTPAQLNAAPGSGDGVRLGGDPRLPVAPVPLPLRLTDRDAFDIRVDNAPFQFFEDALDGVEFDEDLRTRPLRAGERNLVYVQVHTRGWRRAGAVDVDLYFAAAPDPGTPNLPATANAAPLPDLHADFWSSWTQNVLPAPAAATNPPRAVWQRAGQRELLGRVGPNQPEVARFEWTPPAALGGAGRFVALLAVCSSTADPMPANPPTVMADLVRRERRVALRVVPALAFVPDLFIRDGLDDDGTLGGVAFGGRSPDIIVVAAAPADPAAEYADLGDDRAADRVRGNAGANVVYVRVHNRKDVDTAADVELFWALPNAPVSATAGQAGPPFDASKWQAVAPVDAVNVTVPARGTRLARFDFNAAPAPEAGFPNGLAFIALVKSHDGVDPSRCAPRSTRRKSSGGCSSNWRTPTTRRCGR